MECQNKVIYYFSITFLVIVAFSSVFYFLPAMPAIAHFFNASKAQGKLALPFLLLGASISCLFVGVLADAYGAKKVLMGQVLVLLMGLCVCIFAKSMGWFLLGCFMQGLGYYLSVLIKYVKAHHADNTGKVLSILFIVGSLCTPVIMSFTGYICFHYSWVDVLWMWFILVLFCFVIISALSSHPDQVLINLNIKSYFQDMIFYWSNLSFCRVLVLYMSIGGAIAIFFTLSPHIIIEDFNQTPQVYGLLMFIPFVGRLMGNGLNFILVGRLSPNGIILLGMLIAFIAMLSFVVMYFFLPSPLMLMIHVGFLLLAYPLVNTNSMLKVIAINPILSGSALAFLALGGRTVKGLAGFFSARQDGEVMGLMMLGVVSVGLVLYIIIHRYDIRSQKQSTPADPKGD